MITHRSDGAQWVPSTLSTTIGSEWYADAAAMSPFSTIHSAFSYSASAGSLNVSLLNYAAGDVAYVFGCIRDSTTVTTPSGWNQLATGLGGTSRTYIWRRVLTGSEGSIATFTQTATSAWGVGIVIVRGVDTTNPENGAVDVVSFNNAQLFYAGAKTVSDAPGALILFLVVQSTSSGRTVTYSSESDSGDMTSLFASNINPVTAHVASEYFQYSGPINRRTATYSNLNNSGSAFTISLRPSP